MDETDESLHYYYEDEVIYQETIEDLWVHCILPSVTSVFPIYYKIILVNLLFGSIVSTVKLPQTIFHLLSGSSGIFLLSNLESPEGKIIILAFFIQSYLLLHIGCYVQNKYDPVKKQDEIRLLSNSNIVKYCLIAILVLCEYFLLKSETWMEIRGVVMIFSMKLISLAEDAGKGVTIFPSCIQYFGYIFCGSNVMFGPWISFQEYTILYHNPTKKNTWWILGVLRAVATSAIFLIVSNCLANYFIKDDACVWLVAYKEALTFRTSHYFICYLSEASMLAAGFKNHKMWKEPRQWRFVLVEPAKIEFPTALAIVVTNWNKPMHDFLKRYIYKSWLPLGKFHGILATFVISSFLHGFELKVSVVLITIGIFSYLQFAVRDQFAKAFNCCIRVYPCKSCTHKFKRDRVVSRICQLVFASTSVVHLVYLGMIMDSSTDEIGILGKWRNLYFVSFWIMICNVLILI
ncbi:unnamed protein product [Phaedon cochleariae]|uniref:Protein-serine O-palmitoleoyltransferase porcupine n=1 Tax=Phaedon cochleariae TaxID=80249 RepID=A0A9N9SDW4_PHACE|nr:unnamed protein product [Phaedon cochleariae]